MQDIIQNERKHATNKYCRLVSIALLAKRHNTRRGFEQEILVSTICSN